MGFVHCLVDFMLVVLFAGVSVNSVKSGVRNQITEIWVWTNFS